MDVGSNYKEFFWIEFNNQAILNTLALKVHNSKIEFFLLFTLFRNSWQLHFYIIIQVCTFLYIDSILRKHNEEIIY